MKTQTDIYQHIAWNSRTDKYDVNSKDVYDAPRFRQPRILSGWRFSGQFIAYDSLPGDIQRTMMERINGNEQISKFWSKSIDGAPTYRYELVRDGKAYIGRQTQVIQFIDGVGEVGITNHGLYRMGIRFDAHKPYDGILRVKSDCPQTIYLSLRGDDGRILSEHPYHLTGNGSYEQVKFELIPEGDATQGSFGISLKSPGRIELGFAFLQPGEWGRVNGYPLRKMFVDALKRQGVSVIRYNGSMIDVGADSYLYRWKKMIGPIDERRVTFRSGFNMYSTHSFGVVEMLQASEVIGAIPIIGMCMDETAEDISDFVEYANGDVNSEWGALRASHGHPEPYKLQYIQVDNERHLTRGYLECVKKFALAAWAVDPEITIMTSLNIGKKNYKKGSPEYALALEMATWFVEQGKPDKLAWDSHYEGSIRFADFGQDFENVMGVCLQSQLAEDLPGFKLNLHPMEENGIRCDWFRGLAHAHNWNTIQRLGDSFRMVGTANTFQPHGLHYAWNQGRIHYLSDTLWFQPSAHIDEMMMRTWKPNVVYTKSSDAVLDITAKVDEAGRMMTLYIANIGDQPQQASIDIKGFGNWHVTEAHVMGGCSLEEFNTYENKENVCFTPVCITMGKKELTHTFPKYSYTVITLRGRQKK